MHRFFVNERLDGDAVAINDTALLHQWRNVFRLKAGDTIVLFDGKGGEYLAGILKIGKDEALLSLSERLPGAAVSKNLWLFMAIPKKDKFEWAVEKVTELGVSHIVPLLSERAEKKGLNETRLRKIIIEASEQSGRTVLPMLHGAFALGEATEKHRFPLVAFDPTGEPFDAEKAWSADTLGIFIGPEGGWSEKELSLFKEKNIPLVSMGPLTLRAETAAIAASALALQARS